MKTSKRLVSAVIVLFSVILLVSCSSDDDNVNDDPDKAEDPIGDHWVQLFDDDNFKDRSIIIDKEGEYSDLSDLPGANGKDWTDEADSFKVGDSTTMVAWDEINFKGNSTVYEGGEYPSEDEPYSIKIYFGDYDSEAEDDNSDKVAEGCYIQLFDGDDFTDDSLTVKEPGEYANLDDLPGANGENWTDEADSFKVGKNTTVTVWTETDFKGDSQVYEAGEYASVDEPYSMKIECEGNDDND